jgi:hypothetical protein
VRLIFPLIIVIHRLGKVSDTRCDRLRPPGLGERRSPGQMSRVLGAVGVMHLEADDLAAEESRIR